MSDYIKVPFPPSYFMNSTDFIKEGWSFASYDQEMISKALAGVGAGKDVDRTPWIINGQEVRFEMNDKNEVLVSSPTDTTLESIGLTQEDARVLVAFSTTSVSSTKNELMNTQAGLLGVSYLSSINMFIGAGVTLGATTRGSVEHIVTTKDGKMEIKHQLEVQAVYDDDNKRTEYSGPIIRVLDNYTVVNDEDKVSMAYKEEDFNLEIERDFYHELINRLLVRLDDKRPLDQTNIFMMTPFIADKKFADTYFESLAKRSKEEQNMASKSMASYFKDNKYDRQFDAKVNAANTLATPVNKNGMSQVAQRFFDLAVAKTKRDLKAAKIFSDASDLKKLIDQIEKEAARIKSPQKANAFITNVLSPLTNYSDSLLEYANVTQVDGALPEELKADFLSAHKQTVDDNYALAKMLLSKHPISAALPDIRQATERLAVLSRYATAPNDPVFFATAASEVEKLDTMKRSVVKNCLKGGLLVLLGVGLGVIAAGLVVGGLATGLGVPAAVLGGLLGFTALSLLLKGVAVAAAKPNLKQNMANTLQNNLKLFTAKNTVSQFNRANTPSPEPENKSPKSSNRRGSKSE